MIKEMGLGNGHRYKVKNIMGTGLMGWLLDTVYLRTKIIVSMKVNFQIFQRVVKVIKNFQMEMNMKGASWKDCLTGKVSIFGKTE